MKKNRLSQKIFLTTFTFFLVISSFSISKTLAQTPDDTFGGQTVQSIENLSDERRGLMPCDPFSDNTDEQCHPDDAFTLLKTLIQVALYFIIIALFLMLITAGVGYVFNKNSPGYLNKMKKYISYAVVSLIIVIVAMGLVLGILAAIGFDSEVLSLLKKLFAGHDFSLFPRAFAQDIPSPSSDGTGAYKNFFPRETVGSLILKIIKVTTTYIIAPVLVVATIYAGFLFVKAQGKPEEINAAKKFATRLALFILITAAAATVVTVLLNTLNDVSGKVKEQTTNNPTSQIVETLKLV